MKKSAPLILALLLTATGIGSAQADWGHHRDFRPPMPFERHHHEYRERGGWVGPAAILAITGMAIGAAAYNHSYSQPAPVYTAPPPNRGVWYYCSSSGQYYPYTNACPEGWQAVPAR